MICPRERGEPAQVAKRQEKAGALHGPTSFVLGLNREAISEIWDRKVVVEVLTHLPNGIESGSAP